MSTSDEACERMDVTMLGRKQMLCHEDISPIRRCLWPLLWLRRWALRTFAGAVGFLAGLAPKVRQRRWLHEMGYRPSRRARNDFGRGQLHRSAGGTSRRTSSTCRPQPTQVGFPHFWHRTRWHMVGRLSSSNIQACRRLTVSVGSPAQRCIDRLTVATHPRGVRSVLRRVASVVCVLAFAQSAVALCAGWQATPEARMQCCQDGACPLHHHEHGASRTADHTGRGRRLLRAIGEP